MSCVHKCLFTFTENFRHLIKGIAILHTVRMPLLYTTPAIQFLFSSFLNSAMFKPLIICIITVETPLWFCLVVNMDNILKLYKHDNIVPHMHKGIASLGLRLFWLKAMNLFLLAALILYEYKRFHVQCWKWLSCEPLRWSTYLLVMLMLTVQISCVFTSFHSFIHSGCCFVNTARLNALPGIIAHGLLRLHSVAHKNPIRVTWRGHYIFFHDAMIKEQFTILHWPTSMHSNNLWCWLNALNEQTNPIEVNSTL